MISFFKFKNYLEYQWRAKTKYYIHSPFVYQFYLNVLEGNVEVSVKGKHGKLLYSLVNYFHPQNILIVGDSGGSTRYLTLANPEAKIISIRISTETIQPKDYSTLDLILFESSCSKAITLKYFHQCLSGITENSILILEDIYLNKERNDIWKEIKQHPSITLTIDVFQFGICFFRKEKLAKENFVLRY